MNKLRTASEKYFASYLTNMALPYRYEVDWGGKQPDFTVYSDKNMRDVAGIFDTKETDYTPAEKKILFKEKGLLTGSMDPYYRIRAMIESARPQFKFARAYPCIPIFYSMERTILSPLLVFSAMLGNLGMSVSLETDSKTESFFGKDGKMIDSKHNQPQNTTFTAIGILGHLEPEAVLSNYHLELQGRTKDIKMEGKGWIKQVMHIELALRRELAKKGYKNLHLKVPYVDFVVNPYSRLPFPREHLEKGYTYIHEYDLSTQEIKLTFNWAQRSS